MVRKKPKMLNILIFQKNIKQYNSKGWVNDLNDKENMPESDGQRL
jgi:hypothetical protein